MKFRGVRSRSLCCIALVNCDILPRLENISNTWKGVKMKRFISSLLIIICLVLLMFNSCSSKRISLWNGKDFSGWNLIVADNEVDPNEVWSVKNGVIHCAGIPTGYMKTESDYSNYILYIDWRWVEKESNSGVLLHSQEPDKIWPNCIECQLQSGNAGDFVLIGKGAITVEKKNYINTENYLVISKMQESSEKPISEWNRYKIICRDDEITCYVNGVLQNKGTDASLTKGKICIQSEGAPIEFKNIYIELLK